MFDEYVLIGNTAVLKCNIPNYLKDYLIIMAWIEEPTGRTIQLTGSYTIAHHHASNHSKYIMLPSGELYIRKTDNSFNQRTYKCRARHRLNGELFTSNQGKLVITGNNRLYLLIHQN